MTEEQWYEKKKQIKYLRERVRRAKKAKNEQVALELGQLLQAAVDETEGKGTGASTTSTSKTAKTTSSKAKPAKATDKEKEVPVQQQKQQPEVVMKKAKSPTVRTQQPMLPPPPPLPPYHQTGRGIFTQDVQWTSHVFDLKGKDGKFAYQMSCPTGGPGGLICCDQCTKAYSNYMSNSTKNIEEQKSQNVCQEVTDIVQFLDDAKSKLDKAVKLVQQRTGRGPLKRQHKKK